MKYANSGMFILIITLTMSSKIRASKYNAGGIEGCKALNQGSATSCSSCDYPDYEYSNEGCRKRTWWDKNGGYVIPGIIFGLIALCCIGVCLYYGCKDKEGCGCNCNLWAKGDNSGGRNNGRFSSSKRNTR